MKKKACALTFAAVFAISIFSGAVALANNCGNTAMNWSFTAAGQTYSTGGRSKTDTTSSWMHCKTTSVSGYSYQARVIARKAVSGTGYDVGSPTYTFSAGQTKYMVNYVREKGYSIAAILATATRNGTCAVTTDWSPDSI